jgi:beta-glucosidase
VRRGKTVTVSLNIRNSGKVSGRETVQIYMRDMKSSLERPVKELKGFKKTLLGPGKSVSVEFKLDERSFAFYDPDKRAWVAEPGEFEVLAGSSSRDIRLAGKITLT